MKSKAIYDTLIFVLILFLSGPPLASAGASGETAGQSTAPQTASISRPPPAATAAQEISALRDEMPPKRLPLAPRSLGQKLVGTVVAEDGEMSLAIIEHEGTGKQRIYYEGARAEKVLIKSILRNEVIVDAGRGDQRLTMLHGQASGTSGIVAAQQQPVRSQSKATRNPSVHLSREEVETSLKNVDQMMGQVELSPITVYDRPDGMVISNIPPESILTKMGLANGRVIMSVNNEAITSPEQLTLFLKSLKQGGDFTIKVRNKGVRRRTRHIHLEIR